jgi:hypothetical protein
MNNKFSRLEQLEASIDEMQGAIDWWRKESRRLEEGAFRAGFKLGEKHGKGAAGAWFTDIEHAFLRWKNHLNGPNPAEPSDASHSSGSAQSEQCDHSLVKGKCAVCNDA